MIILLFLLGFEVEDFDGLYVWDYWVCLWILRDCYNINKLGMDVKRMSKTFVSKI